VKWTGVSPWKTAIREIYQNALLCMPEEDRELEAVVKIFPLLGWARQMLLAMSSTCI